ncbi:hypothetical protein [Streptomyces sp. NPDC048269]|uniref:hypothetical protein n=1 Tax=Streptomyces sp. NPDC048269 TaxID=3155753 RepID=UPI00341668A2
MPSQRPPRPALTASAVALTLALTACSQSGGGDSGGEPPIGAVPVLLESRTLAFPLASYAADARQRGILAEAQDVLIDQCMQRYGFRYPLRRKAGAVGKGDEGRRYGLSDAAEAARYGYTNLEVNSTPKPPEKQEASMGPNEKLVLYGLEADPSKPVPMTQEESEKSDVATTVVGGQKVPAGGCLRESFLKLYAPSKDAVDIMVPQNFGFEGYSRSQEDSRVRKAIKAWSDCMGKHGYTVDSPMDSQKQLGLNDTNLGSPQAIATAKLDVDCKKQTNLVGIWYTVETAYQKRLIEQNAETLDRAKKQLDERMRLAASLIAAGS